MAKHTVCNGAVTEVGDALWHLKGAFIAAGWTVVGSGNGTTWQHRDAATSHTGTGPGGVNDVITSAAHLYVSGAWFIVQEPSGGGARQYQFARGGTTAQARTEYSASGGFATGSAGPTTPCGQSGKCQGIGNSGTFGTAATLGGSPVTVADYYFHCWVYDEASQGVFGWGYCWAQKTTGDTQYINAMDPVVAASSDTDPVINLYSTTGNMSARGWYRLAGSGESWVAWTLYSRSPNFPSSEPVSIDGKDLASPIGLYRSSAPIATKGETEGVLYRGPARVYPDLFEDDAGVVWVYTKNGNALLPWSDAAPVPLL